MKSTIRKCKNGSPLIVRLLSVLLLAVFVLLVIKPAFEPEGHTSSANHENGFPCSDGDEGPCDESCPCLCCPGHLKVIHLSFSAFFSPTPVTIINRVTHFKENLPVGVQLEVFRPPRLFRG